jgi:hypothetical protein
VRFLQENSLTTRRKIMEYANIGIPQFDGHKYSFWRRRMKKYIQA